jgi:transcriptional regulator with XRE-family HTH domain
MQEKEKKNTKDFFIKLGNKIKEERIKRNISQEKLAKFVGLNNYMSLANYEFGKSRIPVDILLRITNYFKIPLTEFLKFDDSGIDLIPYTSHDEICNNISESGDIVKVSVYSEVGAGNFVDFSSYNSITELYLKKEFYKKNMVAVKVRGESMSPTVRENGYVGIDINDREYLEGKIYAVRIPDEGIAIKRVFYYKDQGKIVLKSDNKNFADRELKTDKIDEDNFIIGRVKWVMQEI